MTQQQDVLGSESGTAVMLIKLHLEEIWDLLTYSLTFQAFSFRRTTIAIPWKKERFSDFIRKIPNNWRAFIHHPNLISERCFSNHKTFDIYLFSPFFMIEVFQQQLFRLKLFCWNGLFVMATVCLATRLNNVLFSTISLVPTLGWEFYLLPF